MHKNVRLPIAYHVIGHPVQYLHEVSRPNILLGMCFFFNKIYCLSVKLGPAFIMEAYKDEKQK